MSKIVVLGAGVCGLVAGMLLRRDGHDVTVLERDAQPAPLAVDGAWDGWERNGVAQFRQPHYLQPRGTAMLEEALPDVVAQLERAGALRFDVLGLMPGLEPRDGDERFVTITARRPVLEQVLARAADSEPGLDVRRGISVRELVARRCNGTPHVTGVRTDSGEELDADLVVDAMGRRSQLPRWLKETGSSPVHEEVEDSGFIYYTRYFRARNGSRPSFRGSLLTPIGTFSLLTLPCDNDTWSVTLYISAGDRTLKRFRERAVWTAVVAACPMHAHLLDGEPITDVLAMGGVIDRYRRFTVDGKPVATGIAPVADAWACSNPSLGRGISLGLLHVELLREVVRRHVEDPRAFAEQWDAVTEAEVAPWYRETVGEDRTRIAEIEALRGRVEIPRPTERVERLRQALLAAIPYDPDAFRAFVASRCCLTRLAQSFADEAFVERILELARGSQPPPLLGPDRAQLLELLDGVASAAAVPN